MSSGAPLTSFSYLALSCLFTIAVNPAIPKVISDQVGDLARKKRTLPLGATTVWVNVGFDETDIALNYGSDILYPVFRGFLVIWNRPCREPVQVVKSY